MAGGSEGSGVNVEKAGAPSWRRGLFEETHGDGPEKGSDDGGAQEVGTWSGEQQEIGGCIGCSGCPPSARKRSAVMFSYAGVRRT